MSAASFFSAEIFNSFSTNRLAPVPEEQTEELLKAIEFPMLETPHLQGIAGGAHQSVIQGAQTPMNVDEQQSPTTPTNPIYTATIFAQDLQNRHQQQQQSSNQDLNPFLGGLGSAQNLSTDSEDKDYKNKYSRNLKAQLP